MSASSRETEVKLAFPSAADALARLERIGGVVVAPRHFEDNRLYDRPDGTLRSSDTVLRLRSAGTRVVLTLKTPVPGDHRHKVRDEIETEVRDAEAVHAILAALGFRVAWRYQKYRTTLRIGEVEASVDETPIGCWVELEGEPERIDGVASALGFDPEAYVRSTYYGLWQRHVAERGLPVGDFVFEGAP